MDVLQELEAQGYRAQFSARPDAALRCSVCHVVSPASTFAGAAIRRLEGASDPADMLAVAALTCPNCGARGTAVLTYGPEASAEDADVLVALRRG
jgi:hypothetical protein